MNPLPLLALLALQPAPSAPAAPPTPPLDYKTLEAPVLTQHVQLTFPEQFVKAGEAYFDHLDQPRWVVFQAIPVPPEGQGPDSNYSMYVARLARDEKGQVTGLERPTLVSPPGSSNTCGWFHPAQPSRLLFGSTLRPPAEQAPAGYSRDRQRYAWQFPAEMHVVTLDAPAGATPDWSVARPEQLRPLFELPHGPGYAAECSWSPDARHVLFTYRDPRTENPDIWAWDSKTNTFTPLVTAKGYNGGPFFSPDGRSITYRSDRKGNNVLQLFLSTLAFDDPADPARITGLKHEFQLTAEAPDKPDQQQAVRWCPYFHPDGSFLVYATSEVGHDNYEVFALRLPTRERLAQGPSDTWPAERDALPKLRITHATGFDGLPVFSRDASLMMWTSQRGPKLAREQRPSSQLWLARFAAPDWSKAAPEHAPAPH